VSVQVHNALHSATSLDTFSTMAKAQEWHWVIDGWLESDAWARTSRQKLWLEATRTNDPDLLVRLGLEKSAKRGGPLILTGVFVEREGREVSARDLRQLQLRPLIAQLSGFMRIESPTVAKPARPGPAGHGRAHWKRVWKLYEQARASGSRSYIQWMRDQWATTVPDATMRRWVKTAKEMHERGEL
jgi:hypothetical protein